MSKEFTSLYDGKQYRDKVDAKIAEYLVETGFKMTRGTAEWIIDQEEDAKNSAF